MKKKGFTLVELIISIALIAIIGVSTTMVIFNKKDKNTYLSQLKELVINSAATKYLSSSENVEKAKDNFGYLVYEVDDLINDGLVDENKFNELLEKTGNQNNDNYKKMVLHYNYGGVNSEGEITYKYPFESNSNNFLLTPRRTTFIKTTAEQDKFWCTYDMFDDVIQEYTYFNENYQKITVKNDEVEEVKCQTPKNFKYTNDIKDLYQKKFYTSLPFSNSSNGFSSSGENNLSYILKVDDKSYYQTSENSEREVTILDFSKLKIVAITINGEEKEITDYGRWYNNVKLRLYDDTRLLTKEDFDGKTGEYKISWNSSGNEVTVLDGNITQAQCVDSGIYSGISAELQYKLFLDNKTTEQKSHYIKLDKDLKIDNTQPYIDMTTAKITEDDGKKTLEFEAKDEHSGIKSVVLQKTNNTDAIILTPTKIDEEKKEATYKAELQQKIKNESEYANWKVIVTDEVGLSIEKKLNEFNKEIITKPFIKVNPKGNIFGFTLQIENIKDNVDIDIESEYINEYNKSRTLKYDNSIILSDHLSVGSSHSIYRYYSFMDLAQQLDSKTTTQRNNGNINDFLNVNSAFDNMSVILKITLNTLSGQQKKYQVRVQLNAINNNIGLELYTTSSNIKFLGINSKSRLVFKARDDNNPAIIYVKEPGDTGVTNVNKSVNSSLCKNPNDNCFDATTVTKFTDSELEFCGTYGSYIYKSCRFCSEQVRHYYAKYRMSLYAPPNPLKIDDTCSGSDKSFSDPSGLNEITEYVTNDANGTNNIDDYLNLYLNKSNYNSSKNNGWVRIESKYVLNDGDYNAIVFFERDGITGLDSYKTFRFKKDVSSGAVQEIK